MRVMQIMAGAQFGGAEAFFMRLVLALDRAGLEQRVVMRADARRQQVLAGAGLESILLPFGGLLDTVTRRGIRRAAAAYGPDIVLCWMSRAARFAPKGGHVLIGRMGGYYDLKYYRQCDHIIGNTSDIVDNLVRRGWHRERAHYLPNFAAASDGPATPRSEFDTPDDAPLLLALGRLHGNKGFDVLLQALARLPGAFLWLAGDGPERRALAALAERLGVDGRVRFIGWRDDVPQLMAAADVIVCPSRHEPLGNVVLEAWAAARPVVAAAAAGPRSLIDDGKSGRLVPVDDWAALAASLGEIIAEPGRAQAMAKEGHARYVQQFSEHVVVTKYLEFFERMVELCAASQA